MHRNLASFVLAVVFFLAGAASSSAQAPPKETVSFDLLVTHGTVVTMDSARHEIEDGVVAVQGDSIAFVGSSANFTQHFPKGTIARQTIDAHGSLILPGFVNGHTHVPMTLMRGLKDDVTLDVWLKDFIFPA